MQISASFVQDSRHTTKSARFVPVQPSQVADVLADHGFRLGHLKTGRARIEDRANHQTTIARYVADQSADMVRVMGPGSSLDLLVRAPHLTGSVEFRLGFFRGVCANQWNAGKLLASVRVPHMAGCLENINRLLPALVAKRAEVANTIERMGARSLNAHELADLTRGVASIRLAGVERVERVELTDLLRLRRDQDTRGDLFSVANVLQENALRFGLRYAQKPSDPLKDTRNMVTRPVIDTTASGIEMTGSIWEAAAALLG